MIFRFKTDEEILKKHTKEFIELYGKDKFEKLDNLFKERSDFRHYLEWTFYKNPNREAFAESIFLNICELLLKEKTKRNFIYNERVKLALLMETAPIEAYKEFVMKEIVMQGVTPRHTLEEVERLTNFIEFMEKKEELTKLDIIQINKEIRMMDLTPIERGTIDISGVSDDDIIFKKKILQFRLHKLIFERDPELIKHNPFKFTTEENKKKFKDMFEQQFKEREVEIDYLEFDLFGEHTDGILYAFAIEAADYYIKIGNERLSINYEKKYKFLFHTVQQANVKINEFFQENVLDFLESTENMKKILMLDKIKKIPNFFKDWFFFFKNIIFNNNMNRYFFFKSFILLALMLSIFISLFIFYSMFNTNFSDSIIQMKAMSFPYLKPLFYGNDVFSYKIKDVDQWDPSSLNYDYYSSKYIGDQPFFFFEILHKFFMNKYDRYEILRLLNLNLKDSLKLYRLEFITTWLLIIPFLLYYHAFKKITTLILDYFNLTKIFLFILIFLTTLLSLFLIIPSLIYFYHKVLGNTIDIKIKNLKNLEKFFEDFLLFHNNKKSSKNFSRFFKLKNIYINEFLNIKEQILDFIKLYKGNQSLIPPYKNITKPIDFTLRSWSGKTATPIKEYIKGGFPGFPSNWEFVIKNKITYSNFSEPLMIYDYFTYNSKLNSAKTALIQKDPLEYLNLHLNHKISTGNRISNNAELLTNYYWSSHITRKNFFEKKYEQEVNLSKIWQKINIRYPIDYIDSIIFGRYFLNVLDFIFNFFNKNNEYNFIKHFREQPLEYMAKPKRIFLTRLIIRTNTLYDFHLYDNYSNRFNKLFFSGFLQENNREKFKTLNLNKIEFYDNKSYNFYENLFLNEINLKLDKRQIFNRHNLKHHDMFMEHYVPNILPETILQLNATYNAKMPLKRFSYNEGKSNIGIHQIEKIKNITFFFQKFFKNSTMFDFQCTLSLSLKYFIGILNNTNAEEMNAPIKFFYKKIIVDDGKNFKEGFEIIPIQPAQMLIYKQKVFEFLKLNYNHTTLRRVFEKDNYIERYHLLNRLNLLSKKIEIKTNIFYLPIKNESKFRYFSIETMSQSLYKG